MIELYLAQASENIDPEVYLMKYSQAVFYRAAHMLALSPQGMSAKLAQADGKTTYYQHSEQLALECCAGGFRVCL